MSQKELRTQRAQKYGQETSQEMGHGNNRKRTYNVTQNDRVPRVKCFKTKKERISEKGIRKLRGKTRRGAESKNSLKNIHHQITRKSNAETVK